MSPFGHAHELLGQKIDEYRDELIAEMESGQRNFKKQTELLALYQEYLQAADKLAGYT